MRLQQLRNSWVFLKNFQSWGIYHCGQWDFIYCPAPCRAKMAAPIIEGGLHVSIFQGCLAWLKNDMLLYCRDCKSQLDGLIFLFCFNTCSILPFSPAVFWDFGSCGSQEPRPVPRSFGIPPVFWVKTQPYLQIETLVGQNNAQTTPNQ